MINIEATIRWKGYDPTNFSEFSKKRVWTVCDRCKKGRWTQYRNCETLCTTCAQIGKHYGKKTMPIPTEHIENSDERMIKPAAGGKIDRAATIRWKGYDPIDLSRGSQRKVWAICEICGCGRWLPYKSYSPRCKACALIGAIVSVETRIKQSKVRKGRMTSTENSNWRGGTSFEPYCPKFNEHFKESIREKFGRTCFLCLTTEEENGRKLSVHHVSYDKDCMCSDIDCEFVPLCISCHGKTGNNREYWELLIMDKLRSSNAFDQQTLANDVEYIYEEFP